MCRGRASAKLIPANRTIRQMMMRRNMRWSLVGPEPCRCEVDPSVGRHQGRPRSQPRVQRGPMAGRSRRSSARRRLRLFLHVLDVGKIDAFGALAGIAKVEFVL